MINDLSCPISASVKGICEIIRAATSHPNTNLPIIKKCLLCGHHFTVTVPIGIHKCPKCGSVLCR